jgi:hypothetical protein
MAYGLRTIHHHKRRYYPATQPRNAGLFRFWRTEVLYDYYLVSTEEALPAHPSCEFRCTIRFLLLWIRGVGVQLDKQVIACTDGEAALFGLQHTLYNLGAIETFRLLSSFKSSHWTSTPAIAQSLFYQSFHRPIATSSSPSSF